MKAAVKPELTQKMFNLSSLNFIRLLRVVITPSVTEVVCKVPVTVNYDSVAFVPS